MKWTDIKIITDRKYRDVFDFVSPEVCPGGFQIEDYHDLEKDVEEIAHVDLIEEDLKRKDRDRITVHHYIPPEGDAEKVRIYLEERLSRLGIPFTVRAESLEREDWENSWKNYYEPVQITPRIGVCPSWLSCDLEGKVIKIDPGMAFGSGTHETTVLCLEALSDGVKGGETVLDVGTGSGILAIAALLLGADNALGIDIDPGAVKVAGENAALNGVEDRFSARTGDLASGITGQYDIITANIVANMVMKLSGDVRKLLKKGGLYISSGIISERKDEVISCLGDLGFKILKVREKNSWVAIEATLE